MHDLPLAAAPISPLRKRLIDDMTMWRYAQVALIGLSPRGLRL